MCVEGFVWLSNLITKIIYRCMRNIRKTNLTTMCAKVRMITTRPSHAITSPKRNFMRHNSILIINIIRIIYTNVNEYKFNIYICRSFVYTIQFLTYA